MPETELPRVSHTRRREIAERPTSTDEHAALLAALPFRDAVEVHPAPDPPGAAPARLRVAAWNAERGRHPEAAAAMLAAIDSDVLLLSELDVGMARTDQRHTARDLAGRLGCGYAYAVEFLELGLGDERERAAHAGTENEWGYHGGAILSRLPLFDPQVVRLEATGRWFGGARGERRVGSRIAVVATVHVGDRSVALASVHLESHGEPAERAEQMQVLLDALAARVGDGPAIIGGDLNTHSLGITEIESREALQRALAVAPTRLREPIPHEPLFEIAARAGFTTADCNEPGPTHRTRSGRSEMKLDWFLCRGLRASQTAIVDAVDAQTGDPLSDHEALAVTVR